MYVSFVREFINIADHLLPYSGTGNYRKSNC